MAFAAERLSHRGSLRGHALGGGLGCRRGLGGRRGRGVVAALPPQAAAKMAAPANRAASRVLWFFILVSISSKGTN